MFHTGDGESSLAPGKCKTALKDLKSLSSFKKHCDSHTMPK